ncbi:MAG: hypothetical protein WC916_02545 [Candidatus Woesearchaeota archaeon]
MNEQIIYPVLLITGGILLSTVVIIVLIRVSNKIVKFFELYPESKGIINFSLRFISWFLGLIILLIFIRLALKFLGLEFTTKITEDAIKLAPKYILAALLILVGSYVSKSIRSRSKEYQFEFKDTILLIMDFIVYMTFIFTALYTIGVNITFFQEFYTVALWVIGGIIVVIVSMIVGIPLGISIYKKTKKKRKKR